MHHRLQQGIVILEYLLTFSTLKHIPTLKQKLPLISY
jgi:hypothetical protein